MSRSRTAVLVAAYRARTPQLSQDPWAGELAGDEGRELAATYDAVNPHAELFIAVRTAFIDDLVRRQPAPQVVLLGAGLDTRAARLGRPGVRFFEVDRAETQEDKLARIRTLKGYPHSAATFVPCELGREDFIEKLVAKGFSAKEPALFIWEGVTLYLSEAAVRATLRRVAEGTHPRSTIVFDFIEKRLAEGKSTRPKDNAMLELLAGLNEPITWGTNDVTPLLFQEGYRHVRTVSFDQACLTFTGTYERDRAFKFQHLATASREREPLPLQRVAPVLPVRHVATALDRYRRLGFRADAYAAENAIYGFLERGPVQLHLTLARGLVPEHSTSACYLYVEDADALYKEWREAGVEGRFHEPFDTPYGLREWSYVDPDGNLLRIGSKLES